MAYARTVRIFGGAPNDHARILEARVDASWGGAAGFDTDREDPIAILGPRSEDLGRLGGRIARPGGAQLHVLEGRDALNRLGESAVAYVQRLGSA